MIKIIKYTIHLLTILLVLIFLSCSANPSLNKSQAYEPAYDIAPVEEEEIEAEKAIEISPKTAYEFEEDMLSDLALKAFEQRAIQKIYDFSDYLNLISDKTLDSAFIDQARQMLGSLFASGRVAITLTYPDINFSRKENLTDFTAYIQDKSSPVLKTSVSQIQIKDSLKQISTSRYNGEIVCVFSIQNNNKNHAVIPDGTYVTTIDIETSKVIKQFGNSEKRIWEVYLRDIDFSGQ